MDRRIINAYHDSNICVDTGDVPIAVSVRNNIIDCIYHGSAVLVDRYGDVIWSIGNSERLVFERSLVKPFKALSIIREGVVDKFCLDDADIAIIAGSHSGTQKHIERVKGILNRCGLNYDVLKCGARLPLGEDALWELTQSNSSISSLHCDCSGEHAGVLALCCHLGFPVENYLDITHPVQEHLRLTIEEFTPHKYEPKIIDRCGMPIAAISLHALASRFSKLITNISNDRSVAKLLNAISLNPYIYTGKKRLIGELIVRSKGDIIGKDGSEGVYTITWLKQGISLAIKVGSGVHRAALPIIENVAYTFGLEFPNLHDCINNGEFADIIGVSNI